MRLYNIIKETMNLRSRTNVTRKNKTTEVTRKNRSRTAKVTQKSRKRQIDNGGERILNNVADVE